MKGKKYVSMQIDILNKMKNMAIINLFTLSHLRPDKSVIYFNIKPSDVFSMASCLYFMLLDSNEIIGFSRLDIKRSIHAWIEEDIIYNNGNYALSGDEYYGLLPTDIIDCCHKKYSTPDMCRIINKKIIGLKIIKLHEESVRKYPNERGLLFQLEYDLELCMSAELSYAGVSSMVLHNKVEIKEELLDKIEYITVF